jgi:hypothetical protein
MPKSLPNFDSLVPYYPVKQTADEIKAYIGGDVDQAHYRNTCIIRVSQALNYTGHPIPPDTGWFRTKKGKDGKWYGLRVTEFWDYLLKVYGKPTVFARKGNNKVIPVSKFAGIRGIVGFRVKGFTDATGHFTLWDGAELLYGGERHDYWGISTEAALWEAGTLRISTPQL